MEEKVQYAAEPQKFKFSLSQLVNIRISDEWGEVQARAQYSNSENQYLIHYQAADKCARTEWFTQSVLDAVEDDKYPGCQVFGVDGVVGLPKGAVVEE